MTEDWVIWGLVSTFGSVMGLIYGPMVLDLIKGWWRDSRG
jgi:hypothetical protein